MFLLPQILFKLLRMHCCSSNKQPFLGSGQSIFLHSISTSTVKAAPNLTFHGFLGFLSTKCRHKSCSRVKQMLHIGVLGILLLTYGYGRCYTTYCVRLDKLLLSLSWNLTLVVIYKTSKREGCSLTCRVCLHSCCSSVPDKFYPPSTAQKQVFVLHRRAWSSLKENVGYHSIRLELEDRK